LNIRAMLEQREGDTLSSSACLSANSQGRQRPEAPCPIRTAFQEDRDRIVHCKAFRRLKHKTQVFLSPEGDHYRTRLTHTLEVSQIARTMARALSLNEDLAEAIALGHDLGHTPFGHAGERVLAELLPGGFHHVQQSLRVVDLLENDGLGLNLTKEVREGISRHSKGRGPILEPAPADRAATLEGQLVRLADIFAYVNHDLDDAERAGLVLPQEIPPTVREVLGVTHARRLETMVTDVIGCTLAIDRTSIRMSDVVAAAIMALRDWLYLHVYQAASVHDDFVKASRIIRELYRYFCTREEELLTCGGRRFTGDAVEVSVADFIAGMSDRFAINLYHRIFLPQPWKIH